MRLIFSGAGRSDIGRVRASNQDSGFVSTTCLLVADGVGGGAAGDIASATAAYAVSDVAVGRRRDAGPRTLEQVLTEGIAASQRGVARAVAGDDALTGMATTMTALLTDGERFALAHLGDSRGYVLRDGDLIRVTNDHTWVAGMLDSGQITNEEALTHPWRNVLLRTVHGAEQDLADIVPLPLRSGDRVLLASDGLTDMVSEHDIARLLTQHGDQDAVDQLVELALAAGGRDNVTCVVATVVPALDETAEDGDAAGYYLGAAQHPGLLAGAVSA